MGIGTSLSTPAFASNTRTTTVAHKPARTQTIHDGKYEPKIFRDGAELHPVRTLSEAATTTPLPTAVRQLAPKPGPPPLTLERAVFDPHGSSPLPEQVERLKHSSIFSSSDRLMGWRLLGRTCRKISPMRV